MALKPSVNNNFGSKRLIFDVNEMYLPHFSHSVQIKVGLFFFYKSTERPLFLSGLLLPSILVL